MDNKITSSDFDLPENEGIPIEIPPPVEIIGSPYSEEYKPIGWYIKETIGIGIINARSIAKVYYDKKQ